MYRQCSPLAANGLARPEELPDTSLVGAFWVPAGAAVAGGSVPNPGAPAVGAAPNPGAPVVGPAPDPGTPAAGGSVATSAASSGSSVSARSSPAGSSPDTSSTSAQGTATQIPTLTSSTGPTPTPVPAGPKLTIKPDPIGVVTPGAYVTFTAQTNGRNGVYGICGFEIEFPGGKMVEGSAAVKSGACSSAVRVPADASTDKGTVDVQVLSRAQGALVSGKFEVTK